MLKVECESCKAPYQVDERRVPATGLKMRCPKCGHTFLVSDPSKGAVRVSAPADAAPADRSEHTMIGVGAFGGGKPAPPGPGGPPAVPRPPAVRPGAGAPIAGDGPDLPAVKARSPAAKAPPGGAAPPPPPAFPMLDDLDLPALAGDAGLPAAVHRAPTHQRKGPPPPPQASPKPPAFNFDVDLPAVPSAGGGGGGFGSIDLPAPKQQPGGFADLPSPKAVAKSGGGFGSIDLPKAKSGGGFGSIDLPTAKGGGFSDQSPT